MVSPETEAKQLHQELMLKSSPGGITPTNEHVLLGRGKSHLNHMGNVWFQKIIEEAVPVYSAEKSVHVKRKITYEIVCRIIRERDGFLRWKKNRWERIPLEDQRQKVAHALQYRIRSIAKEEQHRRDEMMAVNEAEKRGYHGGVGAQQYSASFPQSNHDMYRQGHTSNVHNWTNIDMEKHKRSPTFHSSSLMPPHAQQQYYQRDKSAPSPSTSVGTSTALLRRLVVPTREREPTNNPIRPYAQPVPNPLDFSVRPSGSDNDDQVARIIYEGTRSDPSPHHKEPGASANFNEPSSNEDSEAIRLARHEKKRRREQEAKETGSVEEEEEIFFTKALPRVRFFAVSSSHQLSAENAIA